MPPTPACQLLEAPGHWQRVELISDLHLQAQAPRTFATFARYLRETEADALFILGDLFELWPGDDVAEAPGFDRDCVALLREAGGRQPVYAMHGNRDFMLAERFAQEAGCTLLADPTLLAFAGRRWLLSHGDALCLADTDYQRIRAQVRQSAWQRQVMTWPLAQRLATARQLREQSDARHQGMAPGDHADVDADAARAWLRDCGASTLIHGHTHRPAEHDLGDGLGRIVLTDWSAEADPPRAQALWLDAAGAHRVDLPLG